MLEQANSFIAERLRNAQGIDRMACPIRTGDCLEIAQSMAHLPPLAMNTVIHPSCLNLIRSSNTRRTVTTPIRSTTAPIRGMDND
jgi:hypothetical protein